MFNDCVSRDRIKISLSIFYLIILALTLRLYFLQVYPSEVVAVEMTNHQVENISDVKYRVFDTLGVDMITSKIEHVMVLDTKPFMLNNYEETIEDLMALNFIMKDENSDFNYTDIMNEPGKHYYKVSEETFLKLNKLKDIKGIYTYKNEVLDNKEAWRVETIFSTILDEGFAEGSLGDELNEYIGDNSLPRARFYLDDKANYSEGVLDLGEPEHLKLTINNEWQDEISDILKKEEYNFMDNIGVIVSEVDSGKVRALVQKDETQPNINLGMEQLGYEPGSIFKSFIEAIGLELGLITSKTAYPCTGQICSRNGESFSHGTLTIEDAMAVSCNDIIAVVGRNVGYDNLMNYSEQIGLFQRVFNINGKSGSEATGVRPDESVGMNNLSIGQSIVVTPIQMMGLYNTIANDGIYVKPRIIEAIVDENNNIINEYKSEENRVFSETTAKITQETLVKAVNEGIGLQAKVEGVNIGGKTGTSTGQGRGDHGWYAGYFEYSGKKYSIVVLAPNLPKEHPDGYNAGGANTGAPIFADIVRFITGK